jgi:hypothetical protein
VGTIPEALQELGESGEAHAGVIFVSRRSFRQNDVQGIGRALCALWDREGQIDWTNQTRFLTRAG